MMLETMNALIVLVWYVFTASGNTSPAMDLTEKSSDPISISGLDDFSYPFEDYSMDSET